MKCVLFICALPIEMLQPEILLMQTPLPPLPPPPPPAPSPSLQSLSRPSGSPGHLPPLPLDVNPITFFWYQALLRRMKCARGTLWQNTMRTRSRTPAPEWRRGRQPEVTISASQSMRMSWGVWQEATNVRRSCFPFLLFLETIYSYGIVTSGWRPWIKA